MKKISLLINIFLSLSVFAQKNAPVTPPPVIKLVANKDTIDALKKNDNGLRAILLSFTITGKKPDEQTINLALFNPDSIHSKPKLDNAQLTIRSIVQKDSTTWTGKAICNILLVDTAGIDNESFFIIKKDDLNTASIVVIHSLKNSGTTVSKTEPVLATSATGKAVPYHLDNAETIINPLYTKVKDSVKIETIKIHLKRDSLIKSGETDTVKISAEQVIFPYKIKILEPYLLLDSAAWHRSNDLDTVIHIQNPAIADTLNGTEQVAYIKISGDDKKTFHAIRLTEKGMYNARKAFWMETGANFDLLDGIKANNLYAGIYMFEKDIARIGKCAKNNNLGFTAGVYESKSTSLLQSSDSGLLYRDGTSYSPRFDTTTQTNMYNYYRDTGSITTTTEVQSIGIFFSPHYRLTKKRADENGFHVFLSAYIEMLWQRVNSNFDYKNLGRDSVFSVSNMDDIYKYPFKENSVSSDYRSQYIGIGLPFSLNDNSFSLYINDVFGFCNQRFVAVQDTGLVKRRPDTQQDVLSSRGIITPYQDPKHSWNPFYLLQFRLTEDTYGIVFTGEVRGFFLKNSKSVITLSLSKKFDLGDLFHAIVKPFTPGQ